jgi:hypothetical protein
MTNCFVIQPFDSGKFDKRFDDVYRPAIEAAGIDAYRVDRDPKVEIPIEAIEDGIRSAAICLADITTDNPNVWYELGFAFASGSPVVMVCSEERTTRKYPFDIQHRTVINYKTESSSDFSDLRHTLTSRIKALLDKSAAMRQIADSEQVAPSRGLSQPELMVLAALAGETGLPASSASVWSLKRDVEQSGLTAIGFSLGFRRLAAKDLIEAIRECDEQGEQYDAARLTPDGWDWVERNDSLFVLSKKPGAKDHGPDDDIPF